MRRVGWRRRSGKYRAAILHSPSPSAIPIREGSHLVATPRPAGRNTWSRGRDREHRSHGRRSAVGAWRHSIHVHLAGSLWLRVMTYRFAPMLVGVGGHVPIRAVFAVRFSAAVRRAVALVLMRREGPAVPCSRSATGSMAIAPGEPGHGSSRWRSSWVPLREPRFSSHNKWLAGVPGFVPPSWDPADGFQSDGRDQGRGGRRPGRRCRAAMRSCLPMSQSAASSSTSSARSCTTEASDCGRVVVVPPVGLHGERVQVSARHAYHRWRDHARHGSGHAGSPFPSRPVRSDPYPSAMAVHWLAEFPPQP